MATKKSDEAEVQTDLPTVETAGVTTNSEMLPSADAKEASIGWTVQSDTAMPEDVVASEGAVSKDALPTKEGLASAGVANSETYLSGVTVA